MPVRSPILMLRVVFMLKIVFPICCGIDVHKTFLVATVATTNEKNITSYLTARFSTFTNDLQKLVQWLQSNHCSDVCMESTGKYWIPVYNILEPHCRIVLAHPKYVRAIRGKKTDQKDSVWIADLFKHDLVNGSFIPEKQIRDLREVMRYRFKLVNIRSSEKNRYQNSLTVSNIQLATVVSDVLGVSAQKLIQHLLQHPEDNSFDVLPFLHGSMKKNAKQITDSLEGTFDSVQSRRILCCLDHIKHLDCQVETLEITADILASPYTPALSIIESVPGIGHLSALVILSEIGADMSMFPSANHLTSWAGLTPCNDQSAGKKKSTRISKAGCYIKPVLVQCALAVLNDKQNPYFRLKYQSIKKRRGHKKALIAIARKLLSIIFTLLKNGELYDPKVPEALLYTASARITPEQQLQLLAQKLGYQISKMQDPVASG